MRWLAALLAAVGAFLCFDVAIREWSYHQRHRYAPGVSGELVALAIGAGLAAVAVAIVAYSDYRRYRPPSTLELLGRSYQAQKSRPRHEGEGG